MATVALLSLTLSIAQADWPSYRRDSHRSAASWEAMRPELNLQWVFKPQHGPQAAWPLPGEETPRMHTDRAYHVAVANGLVYFGTSVDNKVHALDVKTGTVRWTFYTGGSVRFAPVIDSDRLYVGSDDGYAYCLNAGDGTLIWKYRPSPADERIVGNGRLVVDRGSEIDQTISHGNVIGTIRMHARRLLAWQGPCRLGPMLGLEHPLQVEFGTHGLPTRGAAVTIPPVTRPIGLSN